MWKSPLLILFLGLGWAGSAQAVGVTEQPFAPRLASILAGDGVEIESSSVSGDPRAFGRFFNGVDSGIGFESGVILSTGKVVDAIGPNDDVAISTDLSDDDRISLTIGFRATVSAIDLKFVFASEEYSEFVGNSTEHVTFRLNGETVGPFGGDEPVGLASVNGGSTENGVAATRAALFVDNAPVGQGAAPFNIQYDGFTVPLTARLSGLLPGQSYSLTIEIKDEFDEDVDSAVLIAAGTLGAGVSAAVPLPASVWMLALGVAAIAARGWRRR